METMLSQITDIIGNAGLSNVDISRFGPRVDGFSVTGNADRYSDVLLYAAAMRSSPNFEDAVVINVAGAAGSRVGFTVVITVPAPVIEEDEEADT